MQAKCLSKAFYAIGTSHLLIWTQGRDPGAKGEASQLLDESGPDQKLVQLCGEQGHGTSRWSHVESSFDQNCKEMSHAVIVHGETVLAAARLGPLSSCNRNQPLEESHRQHGWSVGWASEVSERKRATETTKLASMVNMRHYSVAQITYHPNRIQMVVGNINSVNNLPPLLETLDTGLSGAHHKLEFEAWREAMVTECLASARKLESEHCSLTFCLHDKNHGSWVDNGTVIDIIIPWTIHIIIWLIINRLLPLLSVSATDNCLETLLDILYSERRIPQVQAVIEPIHRHILGRKGRAFVLRSVNDELVMLSRLQLIPPTPERPTWVDHSQSRSRTTSTEERAAIYYDDETSRNGWTIKKCARKLALTVLFRNTLVVAGISGPWESFKKFRNVNFVHCQLVAKYVARCGPNQWIRSRGFNQHCSWALIKKKGVFRQTPQSEVAFLHENF